MILIDKLIPKDCDYCFCNDDNYRCGLLNEEFPLHLSGRLPNCPLREMEKADDTISRQAAIDAIEEMQMPIMRSEFPEEQFVFTGMSEALNAIKRLPSAQPEIIRCKDCKHSAIVNQPYDENYCWQFRFTPDEDGFCNYAERRTDG